MKKVVEGEILVLRIGAQQQHCPLGRNAGDHWNIFVDFFRQKVQQHLLRWPSLLMYVLSKMMKLMHKI